MDALVALAVLLAAVFNLHPPSADVARPPQGAAAIALVIVAAAAVVFRRRWPTAAVAIATAAVSALTAIGRSPFVLDVLVGLTAYMVSARLGRRWSVPAIVIAELALLAGVVVSEATRQVTADHAGDAPRVLILTTFDLDEYVFGALRAGASGFALKNRPLEELLAAIRVVAAGEALLAPTVTRRLISHFARQPHAPGPSPASLDQLTTREREVLVLIAQGLSNAELAGQLHMSIPTAKTHVSRILAKLGARDRAQLVVIAYQTGLVVAG